MFAEDQPERDKKLCTRKTDGSLCTFLLEKLDDSESNPSCIRWEGKNTFRITDGDRLAGLWSAGRKRKISSFKNMARSIRYVAVG